MNRIVTPPIQPLAVIQVVLLPDFQVQTQAQGTINRGSVNMMMETAKQLLIQKIDAAEKGPRVEAAPPGMRLPDHT